MAPKYQVEELLAVRGSVSDSAVSLEKFADEEAIKEHVLRPSASTSRIGQKFESSAPQPSLRSPPRGPAVVTSARKFTTLANASLQSSSPSPSIKKAKIERLIKEHGSPPGRRVTAGGRIVPTEWSYGYVPAAYSNCAPIQPWMHPDPALVRNIAGLGDLPNGFVGYNTNGRLCQIVDGEMRELENGHFFMAAPNVLFPTVRPVAHPGAMNGMSDLPATQHGLQMVPAGLNNVLQSASLGFDRMSCEKQIQFLEGEMKRLRHEHNTIERNEVLQEHGVSAIERAQWVDQKKDLVIAMDKCRRIKKGLEEISSGSGMPLSIEPAVNYAPRGGWSESYPYGAPVLPIGAGQGLLQLPATVPPFHSGNLLPYPAGLQYVQSDVVTVNGTANYALGPAHTVSSQMPTGSDEHDSQPTVNGAHRSPETVVKHQVKRSHAIEIKPPPNGELNVNIKSALDPTSPTYEPRHVFVPPSPSPIGSPALHPVTQNTWLGTDASQSSVSTTNFFPNDAAEHSQRKHTFMYPPNVPHGAEVSAFSGQIHTTTPQKDWVSNAQNTSQGNSPDGNGSLKAPPVSPVETRLSSWTRDILPHLKPASTHGSPDASRVDSGNGTNGTPAAMPHGSGVDSPLTVANVFKGKSNDWCQGYLSGMSSPPAGQPDPACNNDFKAGFYQGLVDQEKKTFSNRTTPEKSTSHSSSQHSGRKNGAIPGPYPVPGISHAPFALPGMVTAAPYEAAHFYTNGDPAKLQAHMPADPMLTGPFMPRTGMVEALNVTHGLKMKPPQNGLSAPRVVSQPVKHDPLRSSNPKTVVVSAPIPSVSSDSGPFVWKEEHLRQKQMASMTQSTAWAPVVRSGNQLATGSRVTSSTFNSKRIYPQGKFFGAQNGTKQLDPIGTRRRANISQVDGASEDLAELDATTCEADATATATQGNSAPSKTADQAEDAASHSKPSTSKKPNLSPSKAKEATKNFVRRVTKGGEDSERPEPAQTDPATQKERRRSQWRARFQDMKKRDREEVRKNRADLGKS